MGRKRPLSRFVRSGFPDLDGFHSSPQPEPFGPTLNCGIIQVDAVVGLFLNMNAILVLSVPIVWNPILTPPPLCFCCRYALSLLFIW